MADAQVAESLALSQGELTALRTQLASPTRREAALSQLLALPETALPAIRARLAALAAGKAASKTWLDKLPTLRRTRVVDPRASRQEQTAGFLAALEQDASPAMLTTVELFVLLRALERQHSIAACDVLVNELFVLEPRLFRSELTRSRKRLGKLMVPAYLRARSSDQLGMQKLAREGLAALGMTSPERLFNNTDPELLAAITRVGSQLGESGALPFMVAQLDDPRLSVREAAREAVAAHADESRDLLRQRWLDVFGEEPDPSWATSRLITKLGEQGDATRERATVEALTQAQQALRKGDLTAVDQQLDRALGNGLSPNTRVLAAATYLELGKKYDENNQLERALVANRRALRVAPRGHDAELARARALYLEAERRVAAGIADLQSLTTAAALEPAHLAAAELREELLGTRAEQAQQLQRRLGLLAATLLALAALLVLRIRATNRRDAADAAQLARTAKSPST